MRADAPPVAGRYRDAIALAVYLFCAVWTLRGTAGKAIGAGVDLPGTLWFHGFLAESLARLRSPTHTSAFFAPDGKDIFSDTGANVLDAALAVPFVAIFGSPSHMAPFVALLLVGNALAMHALLRALGAGTAAVIAGSVAYSFAPSVLHELDGGRPTQALLWFWPLALRELVLMRTDPRWRRPVAAGLFVALQAWTYWFMGHFFAVVFAPALLLWGVVSGARGGWLLRLAVAGGVAIVGVAPGALPMILGLSRGQIPGGSGLTHTTGALDPDAWWILAPWASGLYVPTWWLLILGVALVLCRRRWLWGASAILGILLVAGSRLAIADGSVPNPVWWLASMLPGMGRLLFAARAWPALALVGAAALAEALDRLGPRAVGPFAAVAVVLALATHPAPLLTTEVAVPSYVAAVRGAPGTVLDLPYPCGQLVVQLQPLHGQPMFGGMGEHIKALRPAGVDARIAASPWLQRLISAGLGQHGVTTARDTSVRWVVLHSDVYADPLARLCLRGVPADVSSAAPGVVAARARRELEALLGAPTVSDDRAAAWDLGAAASPGSRP
jgi:hypothetical protein